MYVIPQYRKSQGKLEKKDSFSLIPFGDISIFTIEEKPVVKSLVNNETSWKKKNNQDINTDYSYKQNRIPTPEEAMWKNRNYLTLKEIHSKYDKFSKKLGLCPDEIHTFLSFCEIVYKYSCNDNIIIDNFQISEVDSEKLVWYKRRPPNRERRIL